MNASRTERASSSGARQRQLSQTRGEVGVIDSLGVEDPKSRPEIGAETRTGV